MGRRFDSSSLVRFSASRTVNPAVISSRLGWLAVHVVVLVVADVHAADSRAHSDSNARFLHHIELYDVDNRKVTPESTKPYSSVNTCGRCHDYEKISHGWHFNAFSPDSVAGRQGEPWIWTDSRTGTQLPLSYRDWSHTYDPSDVGITSFEMTRQFGGRLPGGNMGEDLPDESEIKAITAAAAKPADAEAESDGEEGKESEDPADAGEAEEAEEEQPVLPRWLLSGALEIDCMICHAVSGAYDFNARREQVSDENFAWAATAALRLGAIEGEVAKIKDGFDPNDEATQEKMPKVTYDSSRFAPDGTVFMDLIREPSNNACYQCHSNRTVNDAGIEARWIHDEDVHLRAGMACVDCHRNGIDHHIVRGFDGEQHPSGQAVETLSCAGCHLGAQNDSGQHDNSGQHGEDVMARPGRLGAPKPMHAGLPPLHFDKMACTACHSGPAPRDETLRMMTSLAHGLGEKGHRTGFELPAIVGPVYTKGEDGRIHPSRSMWPAFWASLVDGKVEPISPTQTYDLTRRSLRVRQDFVEEVLKPKVSGSELRKLLGEERAKLRDEQWTDAEKAKVNEAQAKEGRQEFNEKVYASLNALEQELELKQAVYVSSGRVYAKGDEEGSLKTIEVDDAKATSMVHWPLAHQVRPAGWSLGVGGCLECHSDGGKIFASTVASVGPSPDLGEPVTMASLQGVDDFQRLAWNQMFQGRKLFKFIISGSIAALVLILLVGIGAAGAWLSGRTA